jgi:ABC-type sugar transport system substrate-binding protein
MGMNIASLERIDDHFDCPPEYASGRRSTVLASQRPPSAISRAGRKSAPPAGAKRLNAPVECRIALFLMADYEYFEFVREDCVATARRHNFSLRVFGAENDSDKQIAQIQACLREPSPLRPTVIFVWPVLEAALLPCAYAAARAGVGWVLLNRRTGYMNHLRDEFSKLPIFSVSADQREIGRIQGKQFRAMLPEGGEVLYLRGPLGTSSASGRFEGVQEVLSDSSIEIISIHSDWTTEGGASAVTEWLAVCGKREFPRFVIGAQNDAMAMGARQALQQAATARGRPPIAKIRISGCDGSPNYGCRLVGEGKLTATVVMPSPAGRAVTELATTLQSGQHKPAAEILITPSSFPDLERLGPSGRESPSEIRGGRGRTDDS